MKPWFTVEKIDEDTYVISEYGHWEETHCYLLCGRERALLIDTGLGVANIKKVIDELTTLPILVVATHVHWDHIGGHKFFDSIAVFEEEERWLSGEFPISLQAVTSFLTALNMKGETIEEITAAARVMRQHCERFLNDMDVLEIVGTGGDGSNTINISTLASIVVSSTGIPVAKHGNRAASSKCGTADCLEALGVKIDLSPEESAKLLKELNICFLFAQKYHTAMRFVGNVRKEMGIRSLFNCLGPLANPAGASMQLLGVYAEELVEPLARVLHNLGVKNAMVVYGQDSIDEISLSAKTTVCQQAHRTP